MRALIPTIPLILAACAAGSGPDAPSLLPRAIERRSDAIVSPAVAVVPDPALDRRISERFVAFDLAVTHFNTALPAIQQKAAGARGAAEGSDRWLDGQSALGDLQQARTATDAAMADLEALAIERASAGSPPYPALDDAIARAQAELDRQAAIERGIKAL